MERASRQIRSGCPIVLIICDGWGIGATDPAEIERRGDAVAMAKTPVRDRLLAECPWSTLVTSGEDVGLPAGQMGNSEVGHLNLGAGRIVHQDVTRISMAIRDGSFFEIPALRELGAALRGPGGARGHPGGALHLIGLCSDGGVHSDISHLHALLDWAERAGVAGPRPLHHPTGATRRRRRDSAGSRSWKRAWAAAARTACRPGGRAPASPPCPVATTRWTATGAGPAPSAPTARSPKPTGPVRPARRPTWRGATPRAPPTSSCRRPWWCRAGAARWAARAAADPRAGSARATPSSSSTSAPTGPGSSPRR